MKANLSMTYMKEKEQYFEFITIPFLIKANSKMDFFMEKEQVIIVMGLYHTKEILSMDYLTEKENIMINMVENPILENSKKIMSMEKELFIIQMEKKNMKEKLIMVNI